MTSFDAPPDGGSWRFNPPPGWPTPPQYGWVPPPNWQPDPSWPPAPPGWPFWAPVGYSTTPPAKPRKHGLKFGTVAGVIAGVVSLVGTVVATWLALADRPDPYTIDQWRQKANATCERDFGDVQVSLNGALLSIGLFATAPPPPGQANAELTTAARSLGEIAAGFRRVSADLREIQVPEDVDRRDIDALLTATGDVATTMSGLGTFLVNYQLGQPSADQMQQVLASLQTLNSTTLPAWNAAAQRLELHQCLEIMGSAPPPKPTDTSTDASGLTTSQRALVARLDPAVLVDCVPAPTAESGGVSAAVNCAAARSGPSQLPLVMQFGDAATMQTWLGGIAAGTASGSCGDGEYTSTWQHNDANVGTLICRPVDGGVYQLIWSFDDANIVAVASAQSGSAIYAWWQSNAYLVVG